MTSSEVIVRINRDGSVMGLSGSGAEELLDFREFGLMQVYRAGWVFFDGLTQTWGWKSADGTISQVGFKTRQEAVASEVANLMEKL